MPGSSRKMALLVEKNMPADKMITVLTEAKALRDEGVQTTGCCDEKEQKVPERSDDC